MSTTPNPLAGDYKPPVYESPVTKAFDSDANNALNLKWGYDVKSSIDTQALIDNQNAARNSQALIQRDAENASKIKYLADVGLLQVAQTGSTENQQSVTPIRTGTGDAIAGTVGVSADAIAASLGNLATSLVPVIAAAVATATSQTLTAVLPVLLTAIGGASTPSQTSSKPTTGATS